MSNRFNQPFYPISSTEPALSAVLTTASVSYPLESTGREWQGPTSRSLRISESSGVDFRLQLGGSSDVVATSSGSMLILGGAVEVFSVPATFSHLAIYTSSTRTSTPSFTLGYGK